MEPTILVAAVVILLVVYLINKLGYSNSLPPGPWGLPIVGYAPFLSEKPYLDFQKLAEKYGDIFSIRLGSFNIILLNDFKSTKEAFNMEEFMGRPPEMPFELNPKTLETGALTGMPWKDIRRFSLHMLRDLGLGKSKMEQHIQEEMVELLDRFEKEGSKPIPIKEFLAPSMSNNMGSMVFGKRLKFNDPTRVMLDRWLTESAQATAQVSRILFFPWIRKVVNYFKRGSDFYITTVSHEFRSYIKKEIEEHKKTFDPGNLRDYIDGFLVEMQKRKGEPAYQDFVLEDLISAFFNAGSETVRITTEWLLLIAAGYKDVQRRVQAEIDETIGRNVFPVYSDHRNMPYTTAVIYESMRWKTTIPINILRSTLQETELQGYYIPKNATIISNIWSVHYDKKFWGNDVDQFKPERFLTEDGKSVKMMEQFIPFSIGKRACPGERLARVETFLYFVAILQHFDVSMPKGKVADFEGVLGVGLHMKPQKLVFTKRN